MKQRERFTSAERDDLTILLPCIMEPTRRTSTRQSGQIRKATDADMLKRASSACRHPGRVTEAIRTLLVELHAPGSVETRERVKAKFPEEDQTCVSERIGSGGQKFLRLREGEWSKQAPGGSVRPTGGPRGNQISQRVVRRGNRRPALFELAANKKDWLRARKVRSWH